MVYILGSSLESFLKETSAFASFMELWACKLAQSQWDLSKPLGFTSSSVGKGSACSAGELSSIPGSGRSPGEGNGSPLQYSCLENPMDRGAWRATVHGVARVGRDLAAKQPPPPNWLQAGN